MARTPTDPTQAQVWITKGLDELDFEFYFPQGPKGDPGGITLGSVLTTTDLNTIVTSGVYRQDNSGNATLARNYPANAEAGVLIVLERIPSSNVIQSYESVSQGGYVTWRRILNAGTWSAWRAKGYTRTDQTAGRAMYAWDEVNNREQLIYGDTGSRNIADLIDATKFTVAIAKIRRIGSQVELRLSLTPLAGVSGTVQLLAGLPTGFRQQHTYNGWGADNANSPIMYSMAFSGGIVTAYGVVASRGFGMNINFQTYDPWPTTLPGIADGAINNA